MAVTDNLGLAVIGGGDYVRHETLNENFAALDALGLCYVAARGVTDGWRWSRWSDGRAECWQRLSASVQTGVACGAGWRSQAVSLTFPVAFASPPIVVASPVSPARPLWAAVRDVTETGASLYYLSFENATHAGALCGVRVFGAVGG